MSFSWIAPFKGYEVEYSQDNEVWNTLTFVSAKGQGQYSEVHRKPALGNNYYRLKMIDLDESFEYSEIKVVDFHPDKLQIIAYPNPFNEVIYLKGITQESTGISIFDTMGKLVYQKDFQGEEGDYMIEINDSLPAGIYILQISVGGHREQFRIQKN